VLDDRGNPKKHKGDITRRERSQASIAYHKREKSLSTLIKAKKNENH